ncbi:uncharacterized LabA/DUF88 family protein [Pseudomonas sp. R151218B TE3479]
MDCSQTHLTNGWICEACCHTSRISKTRTAQLPQLITSPPRSNHHWPPGCRVSKEAQDSYIRALKTTHIRVHYGHHQLEPAKAPRFVDRKTKASREDKVDIWKLEEKETDVHIAISMYRAAAKQTTLKNHERVEQLVLVSSDTDMTPALRALREDFPETTVGVILPHRAELNRPSPGSLKQHAHWIRRVVTCDELQSHQFPNRVPTHKAPAIKPDYW